MRKKLVKDTQMEEQILEAGKRLFFKEGKLYATMQDIADELKVSRPVVNYYYRTKESLMDFFYKDALTCTSKRLNYIIEPGATFYEGVASYIEDTLNHREEYPYLDTFMAIEANCHPLTTDLTEYKAEKLARFLSMVKDEMDKGTILKTEPINFLFDMLSLITYPLVIGSLYKSILSIDEKAYNKALKERKEIILKRLFAK
jgi:TetR/AcrR family transcriptional regulator